jgi:hypothetical protein
MSILYTLSVAGAAAIGVLWMALQNIRVDDADSDR